MELNDSRITKKSHHDQLIWSSPENHDQFSQSSSYKSYTCSFCKKGFSNAQALGGHMNIHRKDRARLRQAFEDEALLSLDITTSASNSIDLDHHDQFSRSSDDKSFDHRRTEDGSDHRKKLQSPEPGGDDKIESRREDLAQNETLDLELRLGPEPRDISARSRR